MNQPSGLTVKCKVHFKNGLKGQKRMQKGETPAPTQVEPGNTPRLSRLMALAIRFEKLIRDGDVNDYADIARLGHVSRARVTQIMNLLHLAPDIQEEILFLPRTPEGQGPISERQIRPIAAAIDWNKQRQLWSELTNSF